LAGSLPGDTRAGSARPPQLPIQHPSFLGYQGGLTPTGWPHTAHPSPRSPSSARASGTPFTLGTQVPVRQMLDTGPAHRADDESKHPRLDAAGDDVIARQRPARTVQDDVGRHIIHQIRKQHRSTNTCQQREEGEHSSTTTVQTWYWLPMLPSAAEWCPKRPPHLC
jgi:hypothetical protein